MAREGTVPGGTVSQLGTVDSEASGLLIFPATYHNLHTIGHSLTQDFPNLLGLYGYRWIPVDQCLSRRGASLSERKHVSYWWSFKGSYWNTLRMRSLGSSRVGLTPVASWSCITIPPSAFAETSSLTRYTMEWIFAGSLLWSAYWYLCYYDVCNAPSNLIVVVDLGQCAAQENARDKPQGSPWKLVPAGPRLRNWNHRYPELSLLVLDCAMQIKAPSTDDSGQSFE